MVRMDYAFVVFRHHPVFGLHYIGIASYALPATWPLLSIFQPTIPNAFP